MKKITEEKKKRLIVVLSGILVFALVFFLAFGLFSGNDSKDKTTENGTYANTSEDVIKDQEVEGLRFSNTSLIMENGRSKLTTEVKNLTGEDIDLQSFDILVKDKDGKEMVTLLGYVGEVIKADETRIITSETDVDLTKAAAIEYVIKY